MKHIKPQLRMFAKTSTGSFLTVLQLILGALILLSLTIVTPEAQAQQNGFGKLYKIERVINDQNVKPKYPSPSAPGYWVWNLEGTRLGDALYTNDGEWKYNPSDIVLRLPAIRPVDIENGLVICNWYCIDMDGQVVGADPKAIEFVTK